MNNRHQREQPHPLNRSGFLQPRRGQAAVEFMIVTPMMLLLVLGAFQFALIYHAKITLNNATYIATRTGTLNGADRDMIDLALARGLSPLFTNNDSVSEVFDARQQVLDDIDDGFICVERINPTDGAFTDFGVPDSTGVIPNDNLLYREPSAGALSGVSIQDANLLKLRVTYCYPMMVPIIGRTIQGLRLDALPPATRDSISNWSEGAPSTFVPTDPGNFQAQCLIQNRIPIVAQGILRMQSAASNDAGFDTDCS